MFDIDSGKLLIIGVVALIVIGPKELPGVLRQLGQAIAKLRRMASEFQGQFMDAMKEAELDDLRKDVAEMTKRDPFGLDPFQGVKGKLEETRAAIDASLAAKPLGADSPVSFDLPKLDAPEPAMPALDPPHLEPALVAAAPADAPSPETIVSAGVAPVVAPTVAEPVAPAPEPRASGLVTGAPP